MYYLLPSVTELLHYVSFSFVVLSVMIYHANTEEMAHMALCSCTKPIFNVCN